MGFRRVIELGRSGFCVAILTALLSAASAQQPPRGVSVGEQYLFMAANAERAQRGIPALRWDATLYAAADFHAQQMAERNAISHQFPGEPELGERVRDAGAHFSAVAENVAEAPTAVGIQTAWMHSPGHRANLLDPNVDSIGIRIVQRGGELYAVEDFSRTVASMSFAQQETMVAQELGRIADLNLLPETEAAHRTCQMESGYAGSKAPGFLMRYTTGDLSVVPDTLRHRIESGRYHSMQVAACASTESQTFSSYRIAVLLYP
jgi:hypothetical protein